MGLVATFKTCLHPPWSVRPTRTGGTLLVLLALLITGCASAPVASHSKPFVFGTDTFSYSNELKWEYGFNEEGHWVSRRREPPPEYSLHCFVVARSVRQFLDHARFDPAQPRTDETAYRRRIREIISRTSLRPSKDADRVVIPGYANLREFSADYEALLKDECGSAVRSYVQRGNWRMIFPVTRKHQEGVSQHLLEQLEEGRSPIVHLFRFPQLTINHAVLVYAASRCEGRIEFSAYDPNLPAAPSTLTFDLATRTFSWPISAYFPGGKVNAYVIYRNCLY